MDKWAIPFQKYRDELIKRKYKDRYSGAFVGDCHSIIYKGGVYGYLPAPKGKLRLYYEWMPLAYIFEALGGKFSIVSIENGKPVVKDSSTVTPLLKRMEKQGFITRTKSTEDSRKVIIKLTTKGDELQEQAAVIPESLVKKIAGDTMDIETLKRLKNDLDQLIKLLNK